MSEASKPKKRDGLSERLVAGERVVLDPESESMHQLNVTATLVWELCDGRLSVDEIAAELVQRFDVTLETAKADVEQAIATFFDLGLLEGSSAGD
ncbi:MAG: PqqD family protein [Acidobacteriota bacterium]